MDKQDLDVLLQARTSELQYEYENLVRSLDAAYESVKAIGRDIAENRAEARRLFDTRLKLARGDDLEAVLKLCSGNSNSDADAFVSAEKQKTSSNGKIQNNDPLPGVVRLYMQPSDANSTRTPTQQHGSHETPQQQPRVVTVTPAGSEGLPRLRPIKHIQPAEATSLLIEHFQQQQQQQQQQNQEPQYSPVYVGDDHSYAVNEEEDEDTAEHQLMLEEQLMVNDAKRKRRENHPAGIDLSIVKTESPDIVLEEQNPLADHPSTIAKPVLVPKSQLSRKTSPRFCKYKDSDEDDEVDRKRKQTRERMRRWRAKKKMEELNRQKYKYKVVMTA